MVGKEEGVVQRHRLQNQYMDTLCGFIETQYTVYNMLSITKATVYSKCTSDQHTKCSISLVNLAMSSP